MACVNLYRFGTLSHGAGQPGGFWFPSIFAMWRVLYRHIFLQVSRLMSGSFIADVTVGLAHFHPMACVSAMRNSRLPRICPPTLAPLG